MSLVRLRHIRVRTTLLAAAIVIVIGTAYVVLAGAVSSELSTRDLRAIGSLRADRHCSELGSFERQFDCVRFVQRAVQTRVPDMRCADDGPIEPMDFLERGYGCCYDRARFMAKTLEYYGLRTRRVALYDLSKYHLLAIAVPGVASHASTEVLTRRGWMGVDSNEPFVLITKAGLPVAYSDIPAVRGHLRYQPSPAKFFDLPLLPVFGLYSRHGRFHGYDLPAPEINYSEFSYNFRGK